MSPWLLVSKRSDDVSESTETLIDALTLLESLACGLGHPDSLAACQIDKVQFTYLDLLGGFAVGFGVEDGHLLQDYNEDSV